MKIWQLFGRLSKHHIPNEMERDSLEYVMEKLTSWVLLPCALMMPYIGQYNIEV